LFGRLLTIDRSDRQIVRIDGLCRLGPVEVSIAQCNKIGLPLFLLGCVQYRHRPGRRGSKNVKRLRRSRPDLGWRRAKLRPLAANATEETAGAVAIE
jgi:hypothetical protein